MMFLIVQICSQSEETLWSAVDHLIDRAPSEHALRWHRLHLLAARLWKTRGVEVPSSLAIEELFQIQRALATDRLLHSVCEVISEEAMVLKGPAVGSLYPETWRRPATDLDLLVPDAERAQRQLIAAGFVPVGPYSDGYYHGLHHQQPLALPEYQSVHVEIHSRCNWIDWSPAPRFDDLAPLSSPGLNGLRTLDAEPHALVIMAHSWNAVPLRRICDLLDIAAMALRCSSEDLESLAERWQLLRMWNTTGAAIEALFYGASRTVPLRAWARDLPAVRERTVLETNLRWLCGPYFALPPRQAAAQAVAHLKARREGLRRPSPAAE